MTLDQDNKTGFPDRITNLIRIEINKQETEKMSFTPGGHQD